MTPAGAALEAPARRSRGALLALGLAALTVFCGLMALGTWQVHRLSWKLDLMARVDARVHAAAVAAPAPPAWPGFDAAAEAYRHVAVSGRFLDERETLVQAVTARGGGFWVLVPFRADAGFTVLVNRGFVPPERRDPASHAPARGETTVSGLLRSPEPGGGFLRRNDPADDRWYSRDVAAIAQARGLGPVAPYFIDADASADPAEYPVGGLTVIAFDNNHLVYALTWYGLAALLAGAGLWVAVDDRRGRHRAASAIGRPAGSAAP